MISTNEVNKMNDFETMIYLNKLSFSMRKENRRNKQLLFKNKVAKGNVWYQNTNKLYKTDKPKVYEYRCETDKGPRTFGFMIQRVTKFLRTKGFLYKVVCTKKKPSDPYSYRIMKGILGYYFIKNINQEIYHLPWWKYLLLKVFGDPEKYIIEKLVSKYFDKGYGIYNGRFVTKP